MKQNLIFLLISLILILAAFFYFTREVVQNTLPAAQPEVETAGPAAPIAPVEPVIENQNPSHPLLVLEHPQAEGVVGSPLAITGEARGNWFFEATFPVVLTDWNGLIIAEGFATAQGDWMTEDFVPFTAELTFSPDTSVSNRGSLILQKANASGLPEHDDAYEITVFFE